MQADDHSVDPVDKVVALIVDVDEVVIRSFIVDVVVREQAVA
jgi:hypothetical protein